MSDVRNPGPDIIPMLPEKGMPNSLGSPAGDECCYFQSPSIQPT